MMECIEQTKPRLPRGIQGLQHMRNTVIRFCNASNSVPYLAPLGDEIVVRIDQNNCGDLFVICYFFHVSSNDSRYQGE